MFSPPPVASESVARMVVRRLEEMGITRVFGIPGGACSAFDDAFYESKIEMVVCAHEAIAGYMAIGYHHATGLPGVAVVTSGPGVLNIATAIAAAKTDEAGLLVLAGDVARTNACRGALQDGGHAGLDILHAMRPLAGLALTIDRPEQASIRLEQALHRCSQGAKGPAFVQVPIDVQNAETARTSFILPPKPSGQAGTPAIAPAAALLRAAQNPVILAGLGVRRAGASEALTQLAEHLSIPVLTDAEVLGAIARDHPLALGTYGIGDCGAGAKWLREKDCDLLFVVGARLDDTTTNGFCKDLAGPRMIQLDYDHRRLARAYAADVAMCGDIELTLRTLARSVPTKGPARLGVVAQQVKEVKDCETALHTEVKNSVNWQKVPPSGFDPRVVASVLQDTFDDNATFVSDIGNHLLAMLRHHTVTGPDAFHFSLGLGAMGSGIGTAMGLAAGGRDNVVVVCGDGGALMCGNDLATCAKYGIRLVMIVFNDGHLSMAQHGSQSVYGRTDPFEVQPFNITKWAKALGADALAVRTLSDLKTAAQWRGEGPLVLDVPIDNAVKYPNPREAMLQFSGEASETAK